MLKDGALNLLKQDFRAMFEENEVTREVDPLGALQLTNKHRGVDSRDDSWKEKIHKPQLSSRMTQLLRNANII